MPGHDAISALPIPASHRAGEKLRGEPEEVGGESSSAGRFGGQDESHPQ